MQSLPKHSKQQALPSVPANHGICGVNAITHETHAYPHYTLRCDMQGLTYTITINNYTAVNRLGASIGFKTLQ
jgi:hypothetical protein